MLAEFLDKLRDIVARGDAIEQSECPTLEKVFVRQGEDYDVFDVPPPRRAHVVHGLDDIVRAAKDPAMAASAEVYHHDAAVEALLDRSDRRDRVTLELEESARFATLAKLEAGVKLTPRDAVRLIRFDLHGTGVDALLPALRKVDFSRKGVGAATIEHGKETLGRSVEAQVQGTEQIPERFRVTTPIYLNPGLRSLSEVTVTCGVFVDVHEERIEIRVLSDELSRAYADVQVAIGDVLREQIGSGVPVFYGRP